MRAARADLPTAWRVPPPSVSRESPGRTESCDPDFIDLDRTVLAQRQCAGLGYPAGFDGVGDRAGGGTAARDYLSKSRQLGAEPLGQPVHEERERLAVRERD